LVFTNDLWGDCSYVVKTYFRWGEIGVGGLGGVNLPLCEGGGDLGEKMENKPLGLGFGDRIAGGLVVR